MLKAIFLILAFSTAFANPDLDDQEFWPFSESPSDLSGSANLEVTLNDEASKDSDQNLFMDSSATVGEYPKLETQLNAAEANDDDGLLAGLGRPSEPFDPFDPFGFDNNAGPPESNIAQPPDFPVPDCGARYLLCCSGKPFGGGMYSKCSWYDEDEADCQIKYFLFCCEYFFEIVHTGWLCERCYPFPVAVRDNTNVAKEK